MPFKRRHHIMGLVLAGIGFATSMPGLPHLHIHHGLRLRAASLVQLDDDEDREISSALIERERDETDDDPNFGEGDG